MQEGSGPGGQPRAPTVCLRTRHMPCSLAHPEGLQPRSIFGGEAGWWGDGSRTADLFSLGRQEVLLGTAPDSDGLRKKPGDEEGSRGFREALRSAPGRAEPRPQDNWRWSASGCRNTAQNNLQLAEAWTSTEAEALLGQCQEWTLQRPPEGTRSLDWSLARSWGQGGAPGPQSRTCPGNCGLLLGER